jgi:hypothetical protein
MIEQLQEIRRKAQGLAFSIGAKRRQGDNTPYLEQWEKRAQLIADALSERIVEAAGEGA